MQTTGNTLLITGGGTGIGRGLAEAFHALGNQVVISGRTQKSLDATTAANPGMRSVVADVSDVSGIHAFADKLIQDFPALNAVINNAGIARGENVRDQPADLADAQAMITTNVLGPVALTAALLPHLLRQPRAAVLNVSSGLAFLPLAVMPVYSATKAFVHSYTESLRYQLRGTPVEVLEIIPPYVQTTLGGEQQANDPHAMPLAEFITEVISLLEKQPEETEINVERVLDLRNAPAGGRAKYAQQFQGFNDAMTAHFGGH